jgi:hypothetical protein
VVVQVKDYFEINSKFPRSWPSCACAEPCSESKGQNSSLFSHELLVELKMLAARTTNVTWNDFLSLFGLWIAPSDRPTGRALEALTEELRIFQTLLASTEFTASI